MLARWRFCLFALLAAIALAVSDSRDRCASASARCFPQQSPCGGGDAGQQRHGDGGSGSEPELVPSHEAREQIAGARRTGHDRLILQMPAEVGGEAVGGFVAAAAVFLERLHHDPVEVAADLFAEFQRLSAALAGDVRKGGAEGADAGARFGRFLFADEALDFRIGGGAQRLWHRAACGR